MQKEDNDGDTIIVHQTAENYCSHYQVEELFFAESSVISIIDQYGKYQNNN